MDVTPRGVPIVTLVDQALAHGDLFSAGYKKTIAVIRPDGSVKRTPTIRVQSAIFTRYLTRADSAGRAEIAHPGDRWMTSKIDEAIDLLWRPARAANSHPESQDA